MNKVMNKKQADEIVKLLFNAIYDERKRIKENQEIDIVDFDHADMTELLYKVEKITGRSYEAECYETADTDGVSFWNSEFGKDCEAEYDQSLISTNFFGELLILDVTELKRLMKYSIKE